MHGIGLLTSLLGVSYCALINIGLVADPRPLACEWFIDPSSVTRTLILVLRFLSTLSPPSLYFACMLVCGLVLLLGDKQHLGLGVWELFLFCLVRSLLGRLCTMFLKM